MRPYLEQMTFLLIIALRAFHISESKYISTLGISNDGMILVVEVNTTLTFFVRVYDSIHILRYINKGVNVRPIIFLYEMFCCCICHSYSFLLPNAVWHLLKMKEVSAPLVNFHGCFSSFHALFAGTDACLWYLRNLLTHEMPLSLY